MPSRSANSEPAGSVPAEVLDDAARHSTAQTSLTVVGIRSVELGLLLTAYNLLVIERYDRILLGRGPFLQAAVLRPWEKFAFCLTAAAETVVLVATLSLLVAWCFGRRRNTRPWLPPALVSGAFAGVITAQYQVLKYFRDGIDLAVLRSLGGGDLNQAIHYAWLEIAGFLPLLAAAVAATILGGYLLHHAFLSGALLRGSVLRWLSPRRVLAGNLGIVLVVVIVAVTDPELSLVLQYVPAHHAYTLVANRLTDWDGDGWGLLDTPRDFAPFDSSRHPYAVEVPGNGIDEDGVGGDLPVAAVQERRLKEQNLDEWDARKLKPRNVLLIVVETARADLLDTEFDGQPVMPVLRQLPGQRLSMFSNSAYTATSTIAMMTGALFDEDRPSLVQRFRRLGYQVGIFSGQNESFGKVDARSHFEEADVVVDARTFPKNLRMYTSTAAGALAVPTPVVNSAFRDWCASRKPDRPFFAYLDWQELHFPYYHDGGARPLLPNPIPRHKITPENQQWLRRTYENEARCIDGGVAEIVRILQNERVFENTVILIVGDHGEELFDHGRLGHGTSVSFEQNAALCKLIHGSWQAPPVPIASSEVTTVLYNSLVRSPTETRSISGDALCYTGTIRQPREVGLVTGAGLLKYDFRQARWFSQARAGDAILRAQPDNHVIYAWESSMVLHPAGHHDSP